MSPAPSAKARASAKVRREKQILAVGSVILLALLGFELPKMLRHGSSETNPSRPTVPATVQSSPLAAAAGKLPDTDRVAIVPQVGQLLSFGLFKGKDPFFQQLGTRVAVPAAPSKPLTPTPKQTRPKRTPPPPASVIPSPVTTSTAPTTVTTPTGSETTPTGTSPTSTTPAPPAVAPSAVLISTNGLCESVAMNGTFPATENIFRVVWIAQDGSSAKISVVGGAYDSGQATATIKLGESLTLVNTADGTRYVIVLKKKCDVQAVKAATTAAPLPATPSTTTTTTTATTPIVTDALDTTTLSG
jgi:hypothetical protein